MSCERPSSSFNCYFLVTETQTSVFSCKHDDLALLISWNGKWLVNFFFYLKWLNWLQLFPPRITILSNDGKNLILYRLITASPTVQLNLYERKIIWRKRMDISGKKQFSLGSKWSFEVRRKIWSQLR